MTQDDGGYDIKPEDKPPAPPPSTPPSTPAPKPGEPGWVPPVPIIERAAPDAAEEPVSDPDVEKNKGLALLGYIFFLIPLVAAPNSKFARFHANQGLLLFILLMINVFAVLLLEGGLWAVNHFLSSVTILSVFFSCGFHLLQIVLLVAWVALMIFGIIQAANGLLKPLPGIGHWTLIK